MNEQTTAQVWLTIGEGVQVGIDRAEAWNMDERDFARLYRKTVYGSSRREAKAWAREQVATRDGFLARASVRPKETR